MSKIQVKARHVDTIDATAQVRLRSGIDEVDDAIAVTIASWWQSPGNVGSELAALSTGATVDHEALADDIHATRREHGYSPFGERWGMTALARMSSDDRQALDALSTWIIQRTAAGTRDYRPAESPVLRYASIVFQQGDDAAETLAIVERDGEHAGLEHLAQWLGDSDPHAYEVYPNPPMGSDDRSYGDGDLLMSYSHRYSYAGLAMRFSD